MNEVQALDGFWASIGHASWPVVFGYAIVALCIGIKGMTEGKAHGTPKAWIGAVTGMAIGVGSSMALEGDWVHAIVFGVLVSGSSTGFWSMVKSTIPEFGKPSNMPPPPPSSSSDRITPKETPVPKRAPAGPGSYSSLGFAVVVALVVLLAGCGARQAQVATQTTLTDLGRVVTAGSDAIVLAIPAARIEARDDARDRCAMGCTPAEVIGYYDESMADIDRAIDGLEVARDALHVAQGAQDTWVATGALPDTGPLCTALGEAVAPLPSLLDEAGVDLPAEQLAILGPGVTAVCSLFATWVGR